MSVRDCRDNIGRYILLRGSPIGRRSNYGPSCYATSPLTASVYVRLGTPGYEHNCVFARRLKRRVRTTAKDPPARYHVVSKTRFGYGGLMGDPPRELGLVDVRLLAAHDLFEDRKASSRAKVPL